VNASAVSAEENVPRISRENVTSDHLQLAAQTQLHTNNNAVTEQKPDTNNSNQLRQAHSLIYN